jgi:hypothetical protein
MKTVLRTMLTISLFLAGVFVLLCALLYLQQDRFIFFPRKNDAELARAWQAQRVEILSGDAAVEDGVGHNNIEQHPDYYRLINGFLDR